MDGLVQALTCTEVWPHVVVMLRVYIMLCAKFGFEPSEDFIAQTTDLRSAQTIRGFCCQKLGFV